MGNAFVGMMIVLSFGAVLAVALCDSFTRQGKLLRTLLVVALPGVGPLIAIYQVVNAQGEPKPSPPIKGPPAEDIAVALAKEAILHSVNPDTK
jgi:hypothetical protein